MISWAASDGREHEGDRVVAAASTVKLFVASAFWRSGLDPDELVTVGDLRPAGDSVLDVVSPRARLTLADLHALMLAASDNTAANALLDRLGLDAVNEEIARLGLEHTVLRRPMMTPGDENLTCARDLARGMAAVAEEPRILAALAQSWHSLLPERLPPEVRVYAKSGDLPTARHEVTLLDDGSTRLAVAVCSSPPAPSEQLADAAARLWPPPNP